MRDSLLTEPTEVLMAGAADVVAEAICAETNAGITARAEARTVAENFMVSLKLRMLTESQPVGMSRLCEEGSAESKA